MRFAQRFAGATLLQSTLAKVSTNATAYAAKQDQSLLIALVNKQADPTSFKLTPASLGSMKLQSRWTLSGPSLSSKTGVAFQEASLPAQTSGDYKIPAYSAALLRFQ